MSEFLTPILLLIFNRPETAERVINEIRKQKPRKLFIAADGPRKDKAGEMEICDLTQKIVLQSINWDCEVKTLLRKENIGCKKAVSEGITWFFEHVEKGIILEDDCVPNECFFTFCEELLAKHQNDNKIMHITGSNLNDNIKFGDGSYYYSNYLNVWGWATWKRAWDKFDSELSDKAFYSKLIDLTFSYPSEREFWKSRLDLIKLNQTDIWDYQWMFSIWKENGISLNTNYNFIENIGFGGAATHTFGKTPYISTAKKNLKQIVHPSKTSNIERAEATFIFLLHGIKRQGYFRYYLHKYFIQRALNLFHKIKLKANKIRFDH